MIAVAGAIAVVAGVATMVLWQGEEPMEVGGGEVREVMQTGARGERVETGESAAAMREELKALEQEAGDWEVELKALEEEEKSLY